MFLDTTCVMYSHTVQVADAVKRYAYLLGQTDLFKYFVDIKVNSICICPLFIHPGTFPESP